MADCDGLLEWFDMPDGARLAAVRVGGSSGAIVIKIVGGLPTIEVVIPLLAPIGASQIALCEEVGQTWLERVGGRPIYSRPMK